MGRIHGLFVVLMLVAVGPAAAITVNWDGDTSTDWMTGTNWSDNAVPSAGNDYVIDTTSPRICTTTGTAFAGGSLSVSTGGQLTIGAHSTVTNSLKLAGGTLYFNNYLFTTQGGVEAVAGTVTYLDGAASDFLGFYQPSGTSLTGTGTIRKIGTGTLSWYARYGTYSAFAGNVDVNQGILRLVLSNGFPVFGGTWNLNAGGTLQSYAENYPTFTGTINLNGGTFHVVQGLVMMTSTTSITVSSDSYIKGTAGYAAGYFMSTVAGVPIPITGSGKLTFQSGWTMFRGPAGGSTCLDMSAYTGAFAFENGAILAAFSNCSHAFEAAGLVSSGTDGALVSRTDGGYLTSVKLKPLAGQTYTYGGLLGQSNTGNMTLTLNGAATGTQVLTNPNSEFAQGTTITSGTLLVGADVGATGNSPLGTGSITLNGGAIGASGTRSIARSIAMTASSYVGGSAGTGDSLSISGVISGSGYSLTKSGLSTVTLSNANTYTGGTNIDGGTLVVGHANALHATTGTITVNSGGKLAVASGITFSRSFALNAGGKIGGNGTFAQSGGVTVPVGAYLDPGMSVGATTFLTGLTINGIYTWELGALSTSNPGVDYDVAYVTGGNLSIGGSSELTIVFGTTPNPTSGNPFWGTNRTWTIIDFSGAGTSTGNFASITGGGVYAGVGKFRTVRSGDDILLQWLSVPVAEAGGPYSCPYGGTVDISGSVTSGGTAPFSYAWDLDNNGSYETAGQNQSLSYGALIALGLAPNAYNTIKLLVSDYASQTDDDTAQLWLDPLQLPVVDAKTGPGPNEYVCPFAGSVLFTGSVLSGGMAPFTFEWDLNMSNGAQYTDALGTSFSRTHSQLLALGITPGVPVQIGLRVTDTYGAQGFDTGTLLLLSPVAEPGSVALVGLGLLGLVRRRRRG